MKSNVPALIAVLGCAALALSACSGSGGGRVPCVEDMPGMTMCQTVPVPGPAPAPTTSPAARSR